MTQIYAYRCPDCRTPHTSTVRADRLPSPHPCVCGSLAPKRRVFQVTMPHVMQEHWNSAVGKPISDMRQFERELRDKGDIATQETGIEHRYAPVDMSDKTALGVDGRGIDESNRIRSRRGEPLLPDIT